ncbi:hypothetical protein FGO68_gene13538 [Halteria grandinella]|uniref:Uncharacterized protein n=1 Tax=Halteria grandinella TaxID=5974 RepID=A0A8J8NHU7_HALGN|nr:hypothetical protein FGO68_gene13538 [Halteria grandinella]
MRCEYLGHLCLYGNYTHGCLKSHKEGGNFKFQQGLLVLTRIVAASDQETEYLQFQSWTLKHLASYPDFKQSVAIRQDDYNPIELALHQYTDYKCWKSKSEWEISSTDKCVYCQIGYYPQYSFTHKEIYIISPDKNITYEGPLNECVQRCKDGKYLELYEPEGSTQNESTIFGIESMECVNCHSSCYQCLGKGADMCISCRAGMFLEISDALINTGWCRTQMTSYSQKVAELIVTGDRKNGSEFQIGGLLQAMRKGYALHQTQGAEKVIIYLKIEINHYVLQKDLVELQGLLIDDQNLISSNYDLFILQVFISFTLTDLKDAALRKMWSVIKKLQSLIKWEEILSFSHRLEESLPSKIQLLIQLTLSSMVSCFFTFQTKSKYPIIQNVIINVGRDDPLIPGTLDCLNSIVPCCTLDVKSTQFKCINPANLEQTLRPRFHKFNSCFAKPISGSLIQIAIYDEGNQYSRDNIPASSYSSILVQGCEFRNFFYEMNSLVTLPQNPDRDYVQYFKPQFNVTLAGNIFDRFSSCGSLFALTEPLEANNYFSYNNDVFGQQGYLNYHIQRQFASKNYYERYSALHIVRNESLIVKIID